MGEMLDVHNMHQKSYKKMKMVLGLVEFRIRRICLLAEGVASDCGWPIPICNCGWPIIGVQENGCSRKRAERVPPNFFSYGLSYGLLVSKKADACAKGQKGFLFIFSPSTS